MQAGWKKDAQQEGMVTINAEPAAECLFSMVILTWVPLECLFSNDSVTFKQECKNNPLAFQKPGRLTMAVSRQHPQQNVNHVIQGKLWFIKMNQEFGCDLCQKNTHNDLYQLSSVLFWIKIQPIHMYRGNLITMLHISCNDLVYIFLSLPLLLALEYLSSCLSSL